jgi:predicted peptidase
MNRLFRLFALLALAGLLAAGCTENARPTPKPTFTAAAKAAVKTGQYAQVFKTPLAKTGKLDYLISVPDDYAAKGPWPVILFLHGAGERGDNVNLVAIHGPPKLIAAGRKVPAIVVSPQCPLGSSWTDHTKALEALLDDIEARYSVDKNRIYVTGLSMGGFGTWALAIDQPKRFAAIAPVCGRGDVAKVAVLKDVPTWVFHGAKDTTVDPQNSKDMVAALKAAGGNVKFTLYPEAGHDSWTATYANEEFWTWLLAQKQP